jgi:choline dehydrogenase-like flavoprotein
VLANRLSEDGTRRVLLPEAGEAYRPNLYPPDLANADVTGGPDGHDWGYMGATGLAGRSIRALRGTALGGCSCVNAAVAMRVQATAQSGPAAASTDGPSKTSRGAAGWPARSLEKPG